MELSHQMLLIADFLRKLFFEHYLASISPSATSIRGEGLVSPWVRSSTSTPIPASRPSISSMATNTRRSTRTHTPRPSPSTSWERSPRRSSTSTSSTVRSTFSSPTTDSSSRPSPSAACSKQKTGRWSMELETIHCLQGLS